MTEVASSFRQKTGRLWILVSLSLLGYLALFFWFPLRSHFKAVPAPDIRSLAPSIPAALIYAALICLLYAFYWLAYRLVRSSSPTISSPPDSIKLDTIQPLSLPAIVVVAALFALPLIFTFPVNATDVYRYYIRGRISAVHRLNPYTVPVADLPAEPFAELAGEWAEATSPYGPLWEITASGPASLFQDDLQLALLAFKAFAALLHLAIAVLIYQALSSASPARRSSITLLWAWNPALLLIFAMDGHNDSLMIFWLMLGWFLLSRGRLYSGLVILMLAPLTKPIALLPLPFIFLACWRQLVNIRSRIFFPAFALITGLAMAFLAFLPFGSPLKLAERLLGEFGSGGGFSLSAALILQLRAWGLNPSITLVNQIAAALLGLLAVWLLWQTWKGRSPLRAAADIFSGYILQAFRFRIWYAAWPFPWLLLDAGYSGPYSVSARARLAAGAAFLLTSQLSVIIYGQFRTGWFAGSQLAAHLIGTAFTFLVPLVIGFASALSGGRSRERQIERSNR